MEKTNKYGRSFKLLRKQANLKLTHFRSLGISPAALSNFENGKSIVNFDKLIIMLKEISVTPNEYLSFIDEVKYIEYELLLEDFFIAIFSNKSTDLKKLQNKVIKHNEYTLYLAIKSTYSNLSSDEKAILSDYFDSIIYWRTLDLFSLFLSLKSLKIYQITYTVKIIFLEKRNSFPTLGQKIIFSHIITHIIIYLISMGDKKESQSILKLFSPLSYRHTMETKTLYEIASGFWIYKFLDPSSGVLKINKSLTIFDTLDISFISKYYKKLLKECASGLPID